MQTSTRSRGAGLGIDPRSSESPGSLIVGFLKRNAYLSFIAGGSLAIGVVYANLYFPALSTIEATLGGLLFGALCALCVAGSRLFEIR